jgi:hypothetical protein
LAVLVFAVMGIVIVALVRGRAPVEDGRSAQRESTEESQYANHPAPLPLSPPDLQESQPRPLLIDPPTNDGNMRAGRSAELALDEDTNRAIDRGVAYLKRTQRGSGSWGSSGHSVGYAALPGLTLLECGVAANDPRVRKAAAFVRGHSADLTGTYELALAILFLERLGEREDRSLIQDFALRLIAGQQPDGGWSYRSPALDDVEQESVLRHLERLRPDSPADLFKPAAGIQAAKSPKSGKGKEPKNGTRKGKDKQASASAAVRDVPALQEPLELRDDPASPASDNSNTQFAVLALWAAQRMGVPVERSLALVVKRFRPCQNGDGGWGYHSGGAKKSPSSGSMTCVGLLGLAVGHGLGRDESAQQDSVQDPQIERALRHLSNRIGDGSGKKKRRPMEDLYFLWSLERVAVLYGQRFIGGKDWYAWGAELLLAHQTEDGNWQGGRYHGSSPPLDTSFALLFLKRANLAHDLTKKIEFLKIESRRAE